MMTTYFTRKKISSTFFSHNLPKVWIFSSRKAIFKQKVRGLQCDLMEILNHCRRTRRAKTTLFFFFFKKNLTVHNSTSQKKKKVHSGTFWSFVYFHYLRILHVFQRILVLLHCLQHGLKSHSYFGFFSWFHGNVFTDQTQIVHILQLFAQTTFSWQLWIGMNH